MVTKDENQPLMRKGRKENSAAVELQLELAASVITRIIERNAGSRAVEAFWDDDSFESISDAEPSLDVEFYDPDEESLPEMDDIRHNEWD